MKKFLVLLLVLAALAPAFADDAKVLPKGVFRLSFVFASNTFDQKFGTDGELADSVYGEVSALTVGTAVEFGVTDQITAAVQWTPAWIFSTSFDTVPAVPNPQNAKATGLADLFVGAKIQVIGANGFIENEKLRVAFAPGALIPLDDPDFTAELTKALNGDEYIVQSPSIQAVGLGFRAYFDWVLNKLFFLNLYNQTIFYLPVTKDAFGTAEAEYAYGYKLTFEAEPHFDYSFSDKVSVSVGVPVTFTMSPDYEVGGAVVADSASSLLTVSPSASVFVMAFMPFELKAGYTLPILGTNANASSTLVLQLKTFLKF